MDDKKFCFIICSNDTLYTQECLYYIDKLNVPDGYKIDVLTIEDARSMTSGYNEGMHYSDAKYKVYLHQDVFIVNRDFMKDCLNLFRQDEKIGMIGNVGAKKLHESGIMWKGIRCGKLYEQHVFETIMCPFDEEVEKSFSEVEVIDGFLMVTQYDIEWREDLFDKWDFYDCSQSMEFIRRGYKVVVPYMDEPWCFHDCGFLSTENYEGERRKFVNEYLSYSDSSAGEMQAGMNEKKFCFIMCSNNKQYTDECLYYINQLNIPEGYEVDVLTVEDARSMTAGYNEAMYSSDAKYKIYIHQDTFMIYRDVLYEIVRFFTENPQVGMIGVLGRTGDNPDASFWNAWNCGRTRAWNAYQEIEVNLSANDTDIPDVKAIDGMFMATQYDIRWREDVIPGWDYYDISQSCEFIRHGYQIAVPHQKEAWCLHDCGASNLRHYDAARRNFCEVYPEFGYRYQESEFQDGMAHRYQILDSVLQLMPKMIEQNEFTAIEMMLEKTSELREKLTELLVIKCSLGIRKLEQGILGHSLFWEGCHSYEELMDQFTEIKFGLRRVEYGLRQEDSRFERWYAEGKVSKECLAYMINFCIYEKDSVWSKIN